MEVTSKAVVRLKGPDAARIEHRGAVTLEVKESWLFGKDGGGNVVMMVPVDSVVTASIEPVRGRK